MELGLEPSTSVTVDEALTGSVGEFGRGQRLMYTVVCSAWIGSGLLTMVRVDEGLKPEQKLTVGSVSRRHELPATSDDLLSVQ